MKDFDFSEPDRGSYMLDSYDATPSDYVSMIITDYGMVGCLILN
jgi:translation initiation factor 2B subunit (eIF-2B alpha/beta/delta family)